ncbi:MAG: hypothetical protein PHS40_09640, partial [Mariniphaga sp.]|nr:hypothetical protein [Mariniphaga sp.]
MSVHFRIYDVRLLYCLFFCALIFQSKAAAPADPPFQKYVVDPWVNETMNRLTLDEKIAQLMMVAV